MKVNVKEVENQGFKYNYCYAYLDFNKGKEVFGHVFVSDNSYLFKAKDNSYQKTMTKEELY